MAAPNQRVNEDISGPGDDIEPDTLEAPAPERAVEAPEPEPPRPSLSETTQQVATSTVAATSKAATAVKDFAKTNTGTTVIILVIGVIAAFVIAYVIYWFIDYTVNDRAKYMLKASQMPIVATQITALTDDDRIPGAGNGKRMSIAFWIYIYDINKYQGTDRHILHRGTEEAKETAASPYIVLDKDSNKIHVTFAPAATADTRKYNNVTYLLSTDTTAPAAAGQSVVKFATAQDEKNFYRAVRGITIDYVPVQRWVHIAVVVNEEVNGGIITAYVDGELVKNVTTYSTKQTINTRTTNWAAGAGAASATTSTTAAIGLNINKADLSVKGKVYVGGSPASTIGPGFSGMVSRITIFNFDMNAKDVYNEYLNGPIDSLLAKMGLPAYGIQSPIYRIG